MALFVDEDELVEFFEFYVSRYGSSAEAQRVMGIKQSEELALRARVAFEVRAKAIRGFDAGDAIVDDRQEAWYLPPHPPGKHFQAVREKLEERLPIETVSAISASADMILASCGNPSGAIEQFRRRGLVVGYVQSGKTTSFMALAAKAADVGYKLVIVLSGITDNLRSQTQRRFDTSGFGQDEKWRALTTPDRDFQLYQLADQDLDGDRPCVAVVKKNPARLRRLLDWLDTSSVAVHRRSPVLIIDDEADQATPNTAKGIERQSTINKLLRKLVKDRTKVTYVAYTATPFANLLMEAKDDDELYPADFIIPLSEPDGYVGARQLFGLPSAEGQDTALDMIREIHEDEAARVRKEHLPNPSGLASSSFLTAVLWFLLATAARRLREGEVKHSTMLINVSTLAASHEVTARGVKSILDDLRRGVETGDEVLRERFEVLWRQEADRVTSNERHRADFESIAAELEAVLRDVEVVVDNYRSETRLDYDGGPKTVIVVGGNTMSRGLTLEGLISSYFLRTSKSYDSLLQMGRWFGFRSGYEDLPRVWMPAQASEWFRHLSLVELELRDELKKYADGQVRPSEAAVRIRRHPQMEVVAAAKNRGKPVSVSFSETRAQTTLFPTTQLRLLKANLAAVDRLVAKLGGSSASVRFASTGNGAGALGFTDVPATSVIEFLHEYKNHPKSQVFVTERIIDYIRKELGAVADDGPARGLTRWNVVFATGQAGRTWEADGDPGFRVQMVQRSSRVPVDAGTDANVGVLVSGSHRLLDVPAELTDSLKTKISSSRAQSGSFTTSDAEQLKWKSGEHHLDAGLLVIYMIDKYSPGSSKAAESGSARYDLNSPADLVGLGIYFPTAIGPESTVEYIAADLPDVAAAEDAFIEAEQTAAEAEALDADWQDADELNEGGA